VNPASLELAGQQEKAQQAAGALGWRLRLIEARSEPVDRSTKGAQSENG
jgi:hypothetical protein